MPDFALIHHLLVALGIGLLIGAERERRKATSAVTSAAGLRTFTIAALEGAVAMAVGATPLLATAAACVAALATISYWRAYDPADPGITTEVVLVATVLLGGLAMVQPEIAGGMAVVVAIVLAARGPLHRFVGETVSEGEVSDLLILAGATLIILPLLPDRAMGPFRALNPHALWQLVILILGINAAGHVATRWLGTRLGVPLLGLASGFVSSSATIGAMGSWVRAIPAALTAGSAAAVLSTVATFVQLGLVIEVTDRAAFAALLGPLSAATLMALTCGGGLTLASLRQPPVENPAVSRSFGMLMALGFAALLAMMLVVVGALRSWFGAPGLLMAAAIAGVLDVHAAAIAVAAQVADGDIAAKAAVLPMLIAFSSSAAAKVFLAFSAGPRGFAARVIPAQLAIIGAAWLAALLA